MALSFYACLPNRYDVVAIFFIASISQDTSARSELRDQGVVEDEAVIAPKDEVDAPVREVEAGPGGKIKL